MSPNVDEDELAYYQYKGEKWEAKSTKGIWKIKADDIPIKGLLGMLGENLGKLLGSESVSGVVAQSDTVIFEPSKIAHVEGRITRAELTPKGLNITCEGVQNQASSRLRKCNSRPYSAQFSRYFGNSQSGELSGWRIGRNVHEL